MSDQNSSALKQIAGNVVLAIAYYASAELSRHIASTPQAVTPVWIPDGIAAGAVLLFGKWIAPGVFVGSFLANFWAFRDPTTVLSLALSTLPVLGIAIGTTLGTLLGVFLLRNSTSAYYPLDRVPNVFKFLILTSLIGPSVNATFGVTCLALSHKVTWAVYGGVWLTWWISNVSGILIVAPVLLSWQQFMQSSEYKIATLLHPSNLWSVAEAIIRFGFILVIADISFLDERHLEYMLIPVLLWTTFRSQPFSITLFTFIVAAIAVVATTHGKGSFAASDQNQSLLQLQSFIGVITITILLLKATISERTQSDLRLRLAFAELETTNELLETRVQQRTEELHEKNITLKQTLTSLERTQLKMLQSEKMSALGQMVAGIAHEINNPIGFIYGNIHHVEGYIQDLLKVIKGYQSYYPTPPQPLQDTLDEIEIDFLQDDLGKILQSMQSGTERIRQIVLSLRNFSRLDESDLKTVDLHEGIDSTLLILQHRLIKSAKFPAVDVKKNYGQLPLVECYPAKLNQVVMHLLNNAIDALQETHQPAQSTAICLSTQVVNTNQVRITISDNGSGIPQDIQSRIFDPFFTTKAVGQGVGLGLSVSYQIVTEQHRGKIACISTLGEGSQFTIDLPIRQDLEDHVASKFKLLDKHF